MSWSSMQSRDLFVSATRLTQAEMLTDEVMYWSFIHIMLSHILLSPWLVLLQKAATGYKISFNLQWTFNILETKCLKGFLPIYQNNKK